jgi:predicted DNA binding CopG/RHH family protein
MKKPLPELNSDEAAEAFVATANLADYDLRAFKPVNFEFQAKSKSVTMRLPDALLDAVKAKAKRLGLPYQRLIRHAIEQEVTSKS